MKALLGQKIGMSQVFSEGGEAVPVTLIIATSNVVMLRRSRDKDGYDAIQLALPRSGNQKMPARSSDKAAPQPRPNQLKKLFIARREFKGSWPQDVVALGVEQFTAGDIVDVVGTSKGKGFAGVVKRHHFKGGPASHGHRHVLRRPGSIGTRFPQHVLKGKKMAGRMGHDRVTVKNLAVMSIDRAKSLIAIKGAIPGVKGSVVEIRCEN